MTYADSQGPDESHPVESLFRVLDEARASTFQSWPIVTVDGRRLSGSAFFPGGHGLWLPRLDAKVPPMPVGGAMVLGNNFSSWEVYTALLGKQSADTGSRTWINLRRFLADAGVGDATCFFTNAYMDLLPGKRMVGLSPGARHPGFTAWCREYFLNHQWPSQQPRVVLALGKHAMRFLAACAPRSLSDWATSSFVDLDRRNRAVVPGARFGAGASTVVALTHPSMPNNAKRRHGSYAGREAEVAMVRAAADGAGLGGRWR